MKSPKGFRGRYFSLAAILAFSTTVTLANQTQSVVATKKEIQKQEELDDKEELTPSAEELDVVVVSKKIKTKESDATFASEIYTKAMIEKSKAKDIYEFLNTQTSVSTIPNIGNVFTQKIDMRGYGIGDGYQNVVITLDGRRLNSIDLVPQLLSSIPLESIDRIEILKGSGSVEYGDGANAGAINIITKGYEGANLKSYVGSNGLKFASLFAGIKQEKFSLSGYIDDYSHDGYKTIANDGTKDESWARNKGIKGTITPIENLTIGLEKTFSKMQLNYPNALTLAEFSNDPNTIPQPSWGTPYSKQYFSSDVWNFWTKYSFNDKFSFDVHMSDEDKVSNFITYNSINNYENKSYSTSLSYQEGDLKTLVGVEKFDGLRKNSTTEISKDNLGYFLKTSYALSASTFNFGVRGEKVEYKYQKNSVALNADEKLSALELGYNYKLDSQSSVFISLNSSYQAPDVDRFFNAFTNTFNGFIKPMKVRTLNTGYSYLGYPNKFKVTAFYSDVEDEIYYDGTKNTNLDKTRKYGLELYDRYNIAYNLYTTLNYAYINTKIRKDALNPTVVGNEIPGVSNHNIKVALGYNPTHRINLLLSHIFKSKTYAMSDFDKSFGKMQSYNTTDFSVSYKYKNYEIFAKVNNIFDETNALFADDGFSLGVYPINYERNFMVGFNAKF
ncbi:MAG TPA: TonB-dependent receptor [Sulfurospirillum sp. UBA12182]|nr:MAG TPA: TonB-dependent receptor [Sulfurospirillum sp. UBA12182]